MPHLRRFACRRFLPAVSLAAVLAAPLAALAIDTPAGASTEKLDVYGPYAAKFLLGGRGLEFPLNAAETLLQADQPWTMSLWFRPAAASKTPLTTLLAGFGDPAQEDSRYLGLKDGKPILRMGHGCRLVRDQRRRLAPHVRNL
jgi:hypothetical protein